MIQYKVSFKDMNSFIPVIDLFAGPGGLGEGFSAYQDPDNSKPFKIVLSIEKDAAAHSTLELRAFFREFVDIPVPKDYYDYLRQEIGRDELFKRHPEQSQNARNQAWHAELGSGDPSNKEIDEKIQNAIGHHPFWVLIGGPPCQAYSTVGRSRMMNHKANFEKDKRHFLYKEYLRIVAIHNPPIFVMENVKGILSSKIKGKNIFNKILQDLKNPSGALSREERARLSHGRTKYYIFSLVTPTKDDSNLLPTDYIIKSEKYNIPQKRHRVILLGIRTDIVDMGIKPCVLKKAQRQIPVRKVIFDLPRLRSGISKKGNVTKEKDSPKAWKAILENIPNCDWVKDKIINPELHQYLSCMSKKICSNLSLGLSFSRAECKPKFKPNWFYDPELGGVCNHVARTHMISDLYRYFFSACFSKLYKRSPRLCDFPKSILPQHDNVDLGVLGEMFPDRFKVQLDGEPSTTITSHISQDGHYYIHPDPTQCRSFTVREAARLQTFPDNYYFEGYQTQQYKQVGNAVPPLLAMQIAKIVHEALAFYISQYPLLLSKPTNLTNELNQ